MQTIQFMFNALDHRAFGSFILNNTPMRLTYSRLHPNIQKDTMFSNLESQYSGDLLHRKAEEQTKLEEANAEHQASLEKMSLGWAYYQSRWSEIFRESSLAYLGNCDYFIMDPHISSDGARHKMRKVPSPLSQYITSEESHSPVDTEKELNSSAHLVSLLMKQRSVSSPYFAFFGISE